ncbi:PAAR domain-containing protein [Umezawaea tangerina]|uniref:Putative Zn-binding protein involved in type VI secretion n=1 Tax=Umezawaea tangerina TaxID=84725 RepID=A0A2T0T068_9PSEU|nr:PAAR domain-containing protein [Umezawaea tangerina]PRY39061.1 putative Zn-binding protein involved in type VI secretion [Umezawaea tangerina]
MGKPAAKMGDQVVGTDVHVVLVPSPGGPVPTPMSLPFSGKIVGGCCATVLVGGRPAATAGSTAVNAPPHVPPSGSFSAPPTNRGTVLGGSPTVLIGGKPAARVGDRVMTCNDPAPLPNGVVQGGGTVLIGP